MRNVICPTIYKNDVEELLFVLEDELNVVSDSIISHQHNVQQYQDVKECAHLGSEGGAL